MALVIRLTRAGAKKRPYYRIVVADKRMPRDGRFIERVGTYDPLLPKGENALEHRVKLKQERIQHWIGQGAKPSDRVQRFLSDAGMMEWKAGNNPEKAKPRAKTLERMQAAEEAKKAAEEAAKETAKAATEEAKADDKPAEEAKAEDKPEEKPAEEAKPEEKPAEEAKAEDKPAEEAKAEDKPKEEAKADESKDESKK